MAIGVTDLLVRVQTDATSALGGMRALGLGLIGLGVGAAAASTQFVKMGIDAQNQLNIIQALTGSTAGQMDYYTKGLEGLASSIGITMTESAKGLYYVVSAGFQGADALKVLKIAAMDAETAGASLKDVANGLTSAMNAYNAKASEAAKYSDIMTIAVVYGKQTFAEFANNIGKAALMAADSHIPFAQLAAAESALTEKGLPAANAMTYLRYMFSKLTVDVPGLKKEVLALGGHFDAAKYQSLDLAHKLLYLRDQTGITNGEFIKLTGGARGSQAALGLVADNGKAFEKILSKMNGTMGQTAEGFKIHTEMLRFGFDRVKAAISVAAYEFVHFITPFLQPLLIQSAQRITALTDAFIKLEPSLAKDLQDVGDFIGHLKPLADALGSLVTYIITNRPVFDALALAIVGIGVAIGTIKVVGLISNFVGLIATLWTSVGAFIASDLATLGFSGAIDTLGVSFGAAAVGEFAFLAPILLIVAAIALAVAAIVGIIWAIKNWDYVVTIFKDNWTNSWRDTGTFFKNVWNDIVGWAGPKLQGLVKLFGGFFEQVGTDTHNRLEDIKTGFQTVWNDITGLAQSVTSKIGGFFSGLGSNIQGAMTSVKTTIGGWVKDVGQSFSGLGSAVSGTAASVSSAVGTWWHNFTDAWGKLLSGFLQGWTKFWAPTGQFFSAFGSATHDFITSMGKNFSDLGAGMHKAWDQLVASPLAKSIGGTFSSYGTQVHDDLMRIVNIITGVFTWYVSGFKAGWDLVSKVTGAFFSNLGTYVHKKLSDIGTLTGDIFSSIGTTIHDHLTAWGKDIGDKFNNFGTLVHTALGIVERIVGQEFSKVGTLIHDSFNTFTKDIGIALDFIGTNIHNKMSEWGADIGKQFSNFGTMIHKQLSTWGTDIGQQFSNFGTLIHTQLNQMGTSIGNWFSQRGTDIHNMLSKWGTDIGAQFSSFGTTVHSHLSQMGVDIGQQFSQFGASINKKLTDIKTLTGDIFSSIGTSIRQHLDQFGGFVNSFLQSVGQVWGRGWNTVNAELGGALNTAWTTLQKFVGNVASAMGTFAHNLVSAAGGWAGSMIQGFISGMRGEWNALTRALGGFFGSGNSKANDGSLVGYVKGLLGIHSPSTAFADIGLNAALGFVKGFGGHNLSNSIGSFINHALGGVGGVIRALIGKNLIDLSQIPIKGWDFIKSLGGSLFGDLQGLLGAVFGGGGGSAPPQHVSGTLMQWLLSAIADTGVPQSWLGGLEIIAMHESGGNPLAVNRTDINARRGTPSEGLMQTIMPTFLANMMSGHTNIWNPIDNAIAAIRYIERRYGNINNVPGVRAVESGHPYVGYATGGWINEPIAGIGLRSGTAYGFGEQGPEYVVPNHRVSPSTGKTFHFENHFHGSNLTVRDVVREQAWQAMLHGGG